MRLGYVNFVRDIVVKLCEELERSDVVAAITAALLQLKELDIVRQINDALVFNGHVATGAKIAGGPLEERLSGAPAWHRARRDAQARWCRRATPKWATSQRSRWQSPPSRAAC